jgi:TonB family protein
MRTRLISRATAFLLVALLGVSAVRTVAVSDPPSSATESSAPNNPVTPDDQVTPPARPLPKSHTSSQMSWYPARAVRLHLQGRVLVEFKIGATGQAIAARVLESDADPLLQQQALKLLQSTTFDVSDPQSNAADETPFRATYRFCLRPCAVLDPYQRSELVTITGASIP